MADKIKSVFGAYSEKLQVVVDKSKEKFAPTWFGKYFDWGVTTIGLTYQTAVGRSRIEAAASVVDRESGAPLRSRAELEKYSGEVPAIKQLFKMKESDYRNYLTIQNMANVSDAMKQKQILDLMWGDVKKAGEAPLKRIDMMVLQALSTGKVTINATTNPDGVVYDDIDLLMPAANKLTVTEKWSIVASSKPITDIKLAVKAAKQRGIVFEKMLMTFDGWWKFQASAEVTAQLAGYFRMGDNQKRVGTLDEVNQMLLANKFPYIELVNESIGIEKSGVITAVDPWNSTSVTFVPSGKLGIIHNAYAIEQLKPVQQVQYATNNHVLISKWSQNNPWAEFTGCELNAFPGLETIDSIFIMDIETKTA